MPIFLKWKEVSVVLIHKTTDGQYVQRFIPKSLPTIDQWQEFLTITVWPYCAKRSYSHLL